MAKLPALHFYPGDWRKDPGVQALDFFNRGVWFELLLLMHESERRGYLLLNGKKMPDEALSRLLGLDKQILQTCLTSLLEFGVASIDEVTGAITCRRMVRDEEIRCKRIYAGSLGGNPKLLKQTPTKKKKQGYLPPEDEDEIENEDLNKRKGVHGEFQNVHLWPDEHAKLKDRWGQCLLSARIEILSAAKASKPDKLKYKSDYAAMLNWDRSGWFDSKHAPAVTAPPTRPENKYQQTRAFMRSLDTTDTSNALAIVEKTKQKMEAK